MDEGRRKEGREEGRKGGRHAMKERKIWIWEDVRKNLYLLRGFDGRKIEEGRWKQIYKCESNRKELKKRENREEEGEEGGKCDEIEEGNKGGKMKV